MKFFSRFVLMLTMLYAGLWLAVAAYFSFAERHKELLESNLSTLFNRPVSIGEVTTDWRGLSPNIKVDHFVVRGDTAGQPALAFETLMAELSPVSLLGFWPKFTEFVVVKPRLEIATLNSNELQIAGIPLKSKYSSGVNPKQLISWLLNHESIVWFDGEVVWRRLNGEVQRYSNISYVYQRDQQRRSMSAAANTIKGALAFKAKSNGDILKSDNWGASLEVLGDKGQRLISPQDLSLSVRDGRGKLSLKTLQIQRVRDFLRLTNVTGPVDWVLDSQLDGRLHDVNFEFSGPFMEFKGWSLSATASDVAFKSVGLTPAMSNLHGRLQASARGGNFKFETQQSTFSWPKWFTRPMPISLASGNFAWQLREPGKIDISLNDGRFEDGNVSIQNLNARCAIPIKSNQIRNIQELADVFRIGDLTFDGGARGDLVSLSKKQARSIFVDGSAEFKVDKLLGIERYFPTDPRIEKFRNWWQNAVLSGSAKNGQIRYVGALSKQAIYNGEAELTGQTELSNVELDYGFPRNWPKLQKGSGIVYLKNSELSIEPKSAWLEEDQITRSRITISSLFKRERSLNLAASMSSSLQRIVEFLFKGPLIKPEKQDPDLPVITQSGTVDTQITVTIPLAKVRDAKVDGHARIKQGKVLLPQGVPVDKVSADIRFTERSAHSDNINAVFLGGATTAKLVTVEAMQPPKMKLSATGNAQINTLQPWLGEHLLSFLDGNTDWRGALLMDGPRLEVSAVSPLVGVAISAPEPLSKEVKQERLLSLSMQIGNKVQKKLDLSVGDKLVAHFEGNLNKGNTLFDRSMISVGAKPLMSEGINFHIEDDQINLDDWLDSVIELASLETQGTQDSFFLDSMRSITVIADDPILFGRPFGAINLSAVSVDGGLWIGTINGDNVNGTLRAEPREKLDSYRFNLSRLHLVEDPAEKTTLAPIDQSLPPSSYPLLELNVNSFRLAGLKLGNLQLMGQPVGQTWKLSKFNLSDKGVTTTAEGQWVNEATSGSISRFDYKTEIHEAGGALDDMELEGFIRRGEGTLSGNLNWVGAPHEFDYSRLNGDFDLRVSDGELVKVEPGSGKLLGLLNFNAIARRVTLNFSDLFSKGLEFDRMRYAGVLAAGEAIMRDAYIFAPSVFINMEGKLNLDKETIDMEIHLSPELGGNLTLLSALANPAAGAVVFLAQQIFKDEMRSSSFKSYRALGSWDDFEIVEFNQQEKDKENLSQRSRVQQ